MTTRPNAFADTMNHAVKHQESPYALSIEEKRTLTRWLFTVLTMVFCMVVIGGVTRLTGSGLSMVEWRPLMGTLPPMGELEWARVFELYKQSPQYQQVNQWMTLADFKWIFFWEYLTYGFTYRVVP